MKLIELTKGKFAKVDDEDYEWLSQWNWCFTPNKTGYAIRQYGTFRHQKHQLMARQIMDNPVGLFVDHINGDTLDNQRHNLRACTHHQNAMNLRKRTNCTSRFKGVAWVKRLSKWRVMISVKKTPTHIGVFTDEIHAAVAYDLWAKDVFGEYARTNFKVEKWG